MCDCWMCNMSEEEQNEGMIEYEYQKYCEETKNPKSKDEWLKSLPNA
jgi:hypothetical protein